MHFPFPTFSFSMSVHTQSYVHVQSHTQRPQKSNDILISLYFFVILVFLGFLQLLDTENTFKVVKVAFWVHCPHITAQNTKHDHLKIRPYIGHKSKPTYFETAQSFSVCM